MESPTSTQAATSRAPSVWRRFWPIVAVGAIGVGGLSPIVVASLEATLPSPSGPPSISPLIVAAVSLTQPLLLVVTAALLGALAARRVGVRSHLVAWAGGDVAPPQALRRSAPRSVAIGGATALVVAALDVALQGALPTGRVVVSHAGSSPVATLIAAALYGGIVEEILLRWGLMTVIAWSIWRATPRRGDSPAPWVVGAALATVAVASGLGWLPALAATIELTPLLLLRTMLLNAIVGVVCGWIVWRWSLEAGMIARASFHVVVAVVSWTGVIR
ncbi:MAG: CPBP family intramembrane metalloprotease [Dehalococcoidia bacterium]|nr:CPBP family intramembrane metalloprotease [Dehalococcoidia bacterium]